MSFVIMLFLSILMMISSILSDRRDIIQLIFVLYLVGARKKILFLATAVFTSLRSLLITIVYSIAMLDNPSIAPTVLFTYVVVTVILSLIMVRGVVPRV
ncbi:MAG: hypothetical protein RMI45_04365 [Ignisphaera sp.]|nr:hypothetical protein [Ignisphaera sp.]MDW8085461.1 hypothetical protein [Ignisphaera sp.]